MIKNWQPFVFGPEFWKIINNELLENFLPRARLETTHSHAQESRSIMLDVEILVRKCLCTVDSGASSPIAVEEVSSLYHKVSNLYVNLRQLFSRLSHRKAWHRLLTTRWNLLPL